MGSTRIPTSGGTRTRRRTAIPAVMLAIGLVVHSHPVAAAPGLQLVSAATSGGTLALSQPSDITLASAAAGATVTMNLGDMAWTDTLNDGAPSSVTIAATDLSKVPAGPVIPFTRIAMTPGSVVTPRPGNTGSLPVVASGTTWFSGSDPTPGTSYSGTVPLVGGSAASEGTWTLSGNAINVALPASTVAATYAASIQYTITG